ncbi:hypothetical protein ACG7TL_002522 [Trametes sanguinea]
MDLDDRPPSASSTASSSSSASPSSSSSSASLHDTLSSNSTSDSSDMEPLPSEVLTEKLLELYSQYYWQERRKIDKTDGILHLLLGEWKASRPEIFRSYLRLTPECFDALVEAIRDNSIFRNRSNNHQAPVAVQAAIALYRFGHYGNAASVMKVALTFGVSYGFVQLATSRFMSACCSEDFRFASVHWPTTAVKNNAKEEVAQVCPGWKNGWCMVDGTLVPLFQRPGIFGNTWFDRKANYSMNVQIVSTPDCTIIDYSVGLPGSAHDASAWKETNLAQNHDKLLASSEWVWADTAYPLTHWCQNVTYLQTLATIIMSHVSVSVQSIASDT